MSTAASTFAPELQVSQWFNSHEPLTLAALRGRVVVLHAFQMLCPGCVSHGLPQASKAREVFPESEVSVIGLHTVFEHHDVMTAAALKVFIHEYRLQFPVGIDQPAAHGSLPLTMQAYELPGTPSLVLIDRQGRIRLNHFGHIEDLALGALVGRLMTESDSAAPGAGHTRADLLGAPALGACDDEACPSS